VFVSFTGLHVYFTALLLNFVSATIIIVLSCFHCPVFTPIQKCPWSQSIISCYSCALLNVWWFEHFAHKYIRHYWSRIRDFRTEASMSDSKRPFYQASNGHWEISRLCECFNLILKNNDSLCTALLKEMASYRIWYSHYRLKTESRGQVVDTPARVQEVSGSNAGPEPVYPEWGFSRFMSLQVNAGLVN
jgi:hypothetical protein